MKLRKRGNLLRREGEGGGRGGELYDRKKAWSSINHLILSEEDYQTQAQQIFSQQNSGKQWR